jgi:hypothetical protein
MVVVRAVKGKGIRPERVEVQGTRGLIFLLKILVRGVLLERMLRQEVVEAVAAYCR